MKIKQDNSFKVLSMVQYIVAYQLFTQYMCSDFLTALSSYCHFAHFSDESEKSWSKIKFNSLPDSGAHALMMLYCLSVSFLQMLKFLKIPRLVFFQFY